MVTKITEASEVEVVAEDKIKANAETTTITKEEVTTSVVVVKA